MKIQATDFYNYKEIEDKQGTYNDNFQITDSDWLKVIF